MPGLLSVVATPIGNLEDITLRALRVLREADLVAAEDTRHTGKLLRHHGIETPTVSFHAHNVKSRLPQLLSRLRQGQHLALVSDAGTPGISDPGIEVVDACRKEGIRVQILPGPTAAVAAAVSSGFPLIPLTFLGFAPHRSIDRAAWFKEASDIPHTFTFFESPHRMQAAIGDIETYFVNRPICVVRELTKAHEEARIFMSKDIKAEDIRLKGEFTIVVGPAPAARPDNTFSDADVAARFEEVSGRLPAASRRDLIVRVAGELGLPRSSVYPALERAKRARTETKS